MYDLTGFFMAELRDTGKRYPGVREGLIKLFREHPRNNYDMPKIRQAFQKVAPSALNYHLGAMKKDGMFLPSDKRGWYMWNSEYKSPEDIRKIIAENPSGRVVQSVDGWKHGTPTGLVVVDSFWAKILKREIESIRARMKSAAPANQVFTEADDLALSELVSEFVKQRTETVDRLTPTAR